MAFLDLLIVIAYLIIITVIGFYFEKKASSGIDSYFLGNRKIPWWALGASGMASNFDVSGTMINVALIYAFGAVGFFVEMRGGLVLIMAFLMIFMGKWNRRSKVMTLSEWMTYRFGDGIQGKSARIISAISTLIITIAIVSYFAVGAGKFIGDVLNIPAFLGFTSEFWAAAIIITFTTLYTVASGLQGVVWTDVFQGILIFAMIIIVCTIAILSANIPETFSISVPLKDGSFLPIEITRDSWTSILPSWKLSFPENSSYSIYNLFGIALIFYLIKVIVEGSAGTGGYMAQRFFAARSDRDAGLLSMFWIFLLSFRWPFIAAIAMLGISYGINSGEIISDPEKVLPTVIFNILPVGLKGILIAGLMAAAMSTFSSLINSGASYWVRDIYQEFINPKADEKKLIIQSRVASILIVLSGLFLAAGIKSINEIWGWLTMGLGAGMVVPLLVRWYWWRMNGYGFTIGTIFGMGSAIIQKIFYPEATEYSSFAILVVSSLTATILGTLLTQQTNKETLINFYKTTRPFGFWKPIKSSLPEEKKIQINSENKRDIIAICFALPWQIVLFLTGMTVILKRFDLFFYLLIILIFLSIGLYYFWFRHLSNEVKLE
ncbi:Na+/proline symporter [Ignavibacterium album JCM 16511]|uniref:Na+/proline symporter n=1 Tax=Ignavibacterium album (strain DSM 19864 / JCM 16511 / NBRC 101810 / Mat9-16) TaxID=945713 RepID=I0AID1_IGNAJ|nr:sodium:solute symporter [Ignavibacterium album]AFH48738.1 Na+/proline symporter [Ignavibacterium album JCM 16511]